MTLDDDVSRLSRTRPFNLMPREAVQLVAFSCRKQRVKAGEILFRPEEEADGAFFVHSGAILLAPPDAPPERARRVGPGALIGHTALFSPIAREVEARAVEPSVVLRIPREIFRRVLLEFPDATLKIRAEVGERVKRLAGALDATRERALDRRAARPARET